MAVDFRRKPNPPIPLEVNGEAVGMVKEFKYQGRVIDNKLDWGAYTLSLVKKSNHFFHNRITKCGSTSMLKLMEELGKD